MSENPLDFLAERSPWKDLSNNLWLASTVKLRRNVEKFKFPGKLDVERRKQIVALMTKELLETETIKIPIVLKGEDLSTQDKEYLVEHFFSLDSFQHAHQGEAFVLDKQANVLININLDDHLHFQYIDYKGDMESAWSSLVRIEMSLGKAIGYSFTPRFGFLTADPMQCGTGLRVHVFLQIPGLIHSEILEDTLAKLSDENITVGGLLGEAQKYVGDIIVIQNNFTLGVNEENILSTMRNYVTKLSIEENSSRSQIKHGENPHIKDLVSRAFGILIHSYQIEAIEAMNAISLLKFGVELGWVEGITIPALNHLFFNCRRAHLLQAIKEKASQEEIAHKRAEFIHKQLKEVKLVI